jgi:hypothetical protein
MLNLVVTLNLRQTPQTVTVNVVLFVVLAVVLALALALALAVERNVAVVLPLQAVERNVAVAVAVVLPLQKTHQRQVQQVSRQQLSQLQSLGPGLHPAVGAAVEAELLQPTRPSQCSLMEVDLLHLISRSLRPSHCRHQLITFVYVAGVGVLPCFALLRPARVLCCCATLFRSVEASASKASSSLFSKAPGSGHGPGGSVSEEPVTGGSSGSGGHGPGLSAGHLNYDGRDFSGSAIVAPAIPGATFNFGGQHYKALRK